jgi:hypothetical protein
MKTPALFALLTALAVSAAAQDLDLVIQHRLQTAGSDGMTVTTEYAERFVRRDDQVWLERVLPVATELPREVRADARRHFNLAAATRWIVRSGDAVPRLMLVDTDEKIVIDVDRSDYGNLGFEGSWETAYFLLDPGMLSRMNRRGPKGADGAQWFEIERAGSTIRLLWDETLKYPREIESISADGTSRKAFKATPVPPAPARPWEAVRQFTRMGYNDLLD